jgi:hypothetical protein
MWYKKIFSLQSFPSTHFFVKMTQIFMLKIQVSAENQVFRTHFLTTRWPKILFCLESLFFGDKPGTQRNFHLRFSLVCRVPAAHPIHR